MKISLALCCVSLLTTLALGTAGQSTEDVPYNQVQFKAAHNSIDRDESIYEQLQWDPKAPHQAGCRGVELDIVADPASVGSGGTWRFAVQHGGEYVPDNPHMRQCLSEIKRWSADHPGHGVVTIHIDLKGGACIGDPGQFADQVDRIFEERLGAESIFRPAQLQRDAETLLAGARKYGWPKLRDLHEKFIICFSGTDGERGVLPHKRTYATTKSESRYAFVDIDMRNAYSTGTDAGYIENPYYNEGWRVFVNLQRGRPGWLLLGKRCHEEGGFVTRIWRLNTEESWEDGVKAQINVVSTDQLSNHEWAKVGDRPYREITRAW